MPKKAANMDKVCGNCRYHNAYEYPDYVFCFNKFSDREYPRFSIFDFCEQWENKLQECFCLEDALKKRGKKIK